MKTIDQDPLKVSWISSAVLKEPRVENGSVARGVLILNQVDPVLDLFPVLDSLFIVVERQGWYGYTRSHRAAIKLVEHVELLPNTRVIFPHSISLDIGPADFVDHNCFRPLPVAQPYDGIAIACWSRRKRIELLIEAAALLPHRKFVHLGHFENNGDSTELAYRAHCLELAAEIAPNLSFLFAGQRRNEDLPTDKVTINQWINQAKLGILTTTNEGINRFKMECMAANRPMLVPNDVQGPTRKHINDATGRFYDPTPQMLAAAVEESLRVHDRYRPRDYLLATTGQDISIGKLRHALREYCGRSGDPYRFDDIMWDGRNDSLRWGQSSLDLIHGILAEYGPRLGRGVSRSTPIAEAV